jgi:hypothetical protein
VKSPMISTEETSAWTRRMRLIARSHDLESRRVVIGRRQPPRGTPVVWSGTAAAALPAVRSRTPAQVGGAEAVPHRIRGILAAAQRQPQPSVEGDRRADLSVRGGDQADITSRVPRPGPALPR